MERNIIRPLNKLPAAASRPPGCEAHSDFTGAVYLDTEFFYLLRSQKHHPEPQLSAGRRRCVLSHGAGTGALGTQERFALR